MKDRQIERQTDTRRRIPVRDIILPVEGCSVCVTEGFSRVGTRRLKKKKKKEEEEEEGEEEENQPAVEESISAAPFLPHSFHRSVDSHSTPSDQLNSM